MEIQDKKYIRTEINNLDGINNEVLEFLEEFWLQDDEKFSSLYDAISELETQITECQELNGWI